LEVAWKHSVQITKSVSEVLHTLPDELVDIVVGFCGNSAHELASFRPEGKTSIATFSAAATVEHKTDFNKATEAWQLAMKTLPAGMVTHVAAFPKQGSVALSNSRQLDVKNGNEFRNGNESVSDRKESASDRKGSGSDRNGSASPNVSKDSDNTLLYALYDPTKVARGARHQHSSDSDDDGADDIYIEEIEETELE
jgi:hypothetical protein